MLNLSEKSKIYVSCPAAFASGGPELLHQLVYKLNNLGFDAYMSYFFYKHQDKTIDPVHDYFKHYNNKYVTNLKDNKDHIIIFPEIETGKIYHYRKSIKIIWWLSVDFFFISWNTNANKKEKLKKKLGIIRRYNFKKMPKLYHLVQSYYAEDFLLKKGIKENVGYLSDYLNKAFLDNAPKEYLEKTRKNQILYNPKKGLDKINQLKEMSPELNWIPIENMTPNQIAKLQQESKLYIDFGFHPGKDRIPREAAISGCCVITGKEGSANYYKDVPIKNDYKFDFNNENKSKIIDKIKDCLINYELRINDFENYRQFILREEKKFENDILSNFIKNI